MFGYKLTRMYGQQSFAYLGKEYQDSNYIFECEKGVSNMNILITGGSGMVGSYLKELLPNAITPTSSELNLTDTESVKILQ